ncbi:hypothetical protein ACQ4M3_21715 [Leptolyngbya sp. AN03gr2]|uniref:hypothetical protein n=1 Tax=unclassified Leptolyngbya TaxID=2650499 RepID=UPI003D31DD0A
MFSQSYYLIRSRIDGSYLAAYPRLDDDQPRSPANGYVLLFSEQYDAMGYLNKFAGEMSDRFTSELVTESQMKPLLDRWGYKGFGVVKDPLIPTIDFLSKT